MFKDLKSILPETIKKTGLACKLESFEVLKIFSRIAGLILAGNLIEKIMPINVEGKQLTVAALSPDVVRELRYFEPKIIQEINEKLGKIAIEKINYIT